MLYTGDNASLQLLIVAYADAAATCSVASETDYAMFAACTQTPSNVHVYNSAVARDISLHSQLLMQQPASNSQLRQGRGNASVYLMLAFR